MNVNEIIALANAGFTAQQIAVMASQAQPQPQPIYQPQPPQVPQTLPAQPVVPNMQPAQAAVVQQPVVPAQPQPQQIPGQIDFAALMGKLDNIGSQIQQANITASQQPAVQTADDILAEIIAPKPPKQGE